MEGLRNRNRGDDPADIDEVLALVSRTGQQQALREVCSVVYSCRMLREGCGLGTASPRRQDRYRSIKTVGHLRTTSQKPVAVKDFTPSAQSPEICFSCRPEKGPSPWRSRINE